MIGGSALNRTSGAARLKRQYGAKAINAYDFSTPFFSQVPKQFDLVGQDWYQAIILSGGAGAGTTSTNDIPLAGRRKEGGLTLTPTEHLSAIKLNRNMMYAGQGEGIIGQSAEATEIARGVERIRDNTERMLFSGTSNILGVVRTGAGSVVNNGGGSYTLTMEASGWIERHWEEGDLVNVGVNSSTAWEITDVDPDNNNKSANPKVTIILSRGSSEVPQPLANVYKQGSQGSGIFGARELLKVTSGSVYGLAFQRRWSPGYFLPNFGTGPTVSMLDNMIEGIHRKTNRVPTCLVTSYDVHAALRSTLEGLKRYNTTTVAPRFNVMKLQGDYKQKADAGLLGFSAMVYDHPLLPNPLPIFISQFVRRDELFAFNFEDPDKFSLKHAKGFGWHDEQGEVWMQEPGKTNLTAVYGGEQQSWISIPHHGVIDGIVT